MGVIPKIGHLKIINGTEELLKSYDTIYRGPCDQDKLNVSGISLQLAIADVPWATRLSIRLIPAHQT